VGAKIAVLGLTFKENCPDLRNTKVPDIVKALKAYNCEITVSDPFADKAEARDHLNIELVALNEVNKNDVVILAVGHNDYKEITKKQWQALFNDKGILIDVKSIYKNDYFTNTDIKHWRL
jgi:UDP-N-acetyl-D-galactosamine dehydrogenase